MLRPHISERALKVEFKHLDRYGHVNNARCLEILEEGRWQFLRELRAGEDQVEKQGYGPVIIKMEIEFRKEMRIDESIFVRTWTEFLNKRFFYIHQQILRSAKDVCVNAKFYHALFNIHTRRLSELSPFWLDLIQSHSILKEHQ